jgi:hypothetical protein
MTDLCTSVRDDLLDDLAVAVTQHHAHLEGCASCRALRRSLDEVSRELAALPALVPPIALQARTDARLAELSPAVNASIAVDREASPATTETPSTTEGTVSAAPDVVRVGVGGLFASLLAALAAGGVALVEYVGALVRRGRDSAPLADRRRWGRVLLWTTPAAAGVGLVGLLLVVPILSAPGSEQVALSDPSRRSSADAMEDKDSDGPVDRSRLGWGDLLGTGGDTGGYRGEGGQFAFAAGVLDRRAELEQRNFEAPAEDLPTGTTSSTVTLPLVDEVTVAEQELDEQELDEEQLVEEQLVDGERVANERNQRAGQAEARLRSTVELEWGAAAAQGIDRDDGAAWAPSAGYLLPITDGDRGRAQAFFEARRRVEGVATQPGTGYWANAYVPGDRSLRTAHRELARAADRFAGQSPLALAEQARVYDAPFDPPREGALSLAVDADLRAVDGRARVMMRVGLTAAQRVGVRRPVRMAVVLDLRRPLGDAERTQVRTLVQALTSVRDQGDRIGLVAAGPGGGVLVAPTALRYGRATVALDEVLASTTTDVVTIDDAVREAVAAVGAPEDLGTSIVVVVTPGLAGAEASLETLAHTAALGGVTTTVVGLSGAPEAALDAVALAGEGRRWRLGDDVDAEALVRDELEAASRVVARAVRLRVRLAPGVELVDVLGSHRLDAGAAARVRASEAAIDGRVAAQLGIDSDRGSDEDGVQIVIPAFYSGDRHVVLLDLIVAGPGPVADVQLRSKDLVRLVNHTASATLALDRGVDTGTAQARSVLTSALGVEIARSYLEAARLVEAGDATSARARIDEVRSLVAGIGAEMPELGRDPAVGDDLVLLGRYLIALDEAHAPSSLASLATSLRYAGRRKLAPVHAGASDR